MFAGMTLLVLVLSIMYFAASQGKFAGGGLCNITSNGVQGCKDVYSSRYAHILGFSNVYLGIIGFFLLFALAVFYRSFPLKEVALLIMICMTFALITVVWFLYLQYYVIQALCGYCMIIDTVVILMSLVYCYTLIKRKDLRPWSA